MSNIKKHTEEKDIAKLLVNEFGEDIELLLENNKAMPDYLWNNKLWELKSASSKTSIDTQIRKGISQIQSNIGGIVLDIRNSKLSNAQILSAIYYRINRSCNKTIDVIIVKDNTIQTIIRYKKIET